MLQKRKKYKVDFENEKYCGDALLQKTFIQDCISKKVVKDTGQLDQVLVENFHTPTISRDMRKAILTEFARRGAGKSPSIKRAMQAKGMLQNSI